VVFEKVRVFGQVDGVQGQLAQAFAAVGVGCAGRGDAATAEFRAGAVLFAVSVVIRKYWELNVPGNP